MKSQSFSSRLLVVFAAELVNKVFVIASFIWLAHTLDPAVYGDVEWALSIMTVFMIAAHGGLSTWAAARVATEPERAAALAVHVGVLRLALAALAYLLLSVVAWTYGGQAGAALAVYGLVLFFTPFFLEYFFNGLLQSRWAALGQAVRGATFAIAVVMLVDARSAPTIVALAEVLSAAALAVCNLLIIRYAFSVPLRLEGQRKKLLWPLQQSWTIGASELTWGVHWYAGLILLGYLATATDVAWHSAALRLVMSLHTIVWLYHVVLLPNLARVVLTDRAAWTRLVQRSLRLTGWIGFGIALAGTLAARTILTTVFGPPFVAAVPGLQAVIWIVPVAWISGHIRYSLIAAQHPSKVYQATLVGAGTTIAVALLLVPAARSVGAGLALLGGTITTGVAAALLARRVLPEFGLRKNLAASAACCLVCLVLGTILKPVAGEVLSTLFAVAVLTAFAIYAERDSARGFLRGLAGDFKLTMARTDVGTTDVST